MLAPRTLSGLLDLASLPVEAIPTSSRAMARLSRLDWFAVTRAGSNGLVARIAPNLHPDCRPKLGLHLPCGGERGAGYESGIRPGRGDDERRGCRRPIHANGLFRHSELPTQLRVLPTKRRRRT